MFWAHTNPSFVRSVCNPKAEKNRVANWPTFFRGFHHGVQEPDAFQSQVHNYKDSWAQGFTGASGHMHMLWHQFWNRCITNCKHIVFNRFVVPSGGAGEDPRTNLLFAFVVPFCLFWGRLVRPGSPRYTPRPPKWTAGLPQRLPKEPKATSKTPRFIKL